MVRRRWIAAMAGTVCAWAMATGSAWADSPVVACVPTTAGAALTKAPATGACPGGGTKRSLVAQSDLNAAKARVAQLEALLAGVTRGTVNGQPAITFSGVNVRIVNGSGSTASTNGRGNLFLGYDALPGEQTGSHNIVAGDRNTIRSYGSLVVGSQSRSSAQGQAIIGFDNGADHKYASITGGTGNKVTADYGWVAGGSRNTASAFGASVAGGCANVAGGAAVPDTDPCDTIGGRWSTIGGGEGNAATASAAHVSGGYGNRANGPWAAIAGGRSGTALGGFATVGGGRDNGATFDYASVAGGEENIARGVGGSILGGFTNTVTGLDAIVAGGSEAQAVGNFSAILGGQNVLVEADHGRSP